VCIGAVPMWLIVLYDGSIDSRIGDKPCGGQLVGTIEVVIVYVQVDLHLAPQLD